MDKLNYEIAQTLLKHKKELLNHPDIFKDLLENLKKAAGFRTTDDPNDDIEGDDDASKWLSENSATKPAVEDKQSKKYASKKWEPRKDYSDKEKAAIKQLADSGFTEREAEHLSGAYKGPKDMQSAAHSNVEHPMISDKMMDHLKGVGTPDESMKDFHGLAADWLSQADKNEKSNADPEKNPVKYAAGVLNNAYEKHSAGFENDYNKFLNSDDVKGLKGRDRHKAIEGWKSSWKQAHPEHKEGLKDVSEAQKVHGDYGFSNAAAKKNLQEKIDHIASGGQSNPTETTVEEGLQHLGGSGKTEDQQSGTVFHDPSAAYAAKNPQLASLLKPEQKERMDRVDSAANAQGKIRIRRKSEGTT